MAENLNSFIDKVSIKNEITEDDFSSKNIYLLGSSEYGAINEPTLIKDILEFENKFGVNGNLHTAFENLLNTNSNLNIVICKVTGVHAYTYLNVLDSDDIKLENVIYIEAFEASENYNKVMINIDENTLSFVYPLSLGGNIISYNLNDYIYLGALVKTINNDTAEGKNKVYISTDADYFIETKKMYLANKSTQSLLNGDSGLNFTKNEYYNSLEKTYSSLEGYEIDIIVPINAFVDDVIFIGQEDNVFLNRTDYLNITNETKQLTFANSLLNFCIKQLNFGLLTHGIIGFNKIDLNLFKDNKTEYINNVLIKSVREIQNSFDYKEYSFLLSVVSNDLSYNNSNIDNGYLAYAGALSSANINSTTTNKKIENVSMCAYFDENELKLLASYGIIGFRYSAYKIGTVVYSGITLMNESHDMHYICNVRMIQLIISFIRKQINKLIGETLDNLFKNDNIKNLFLFLLNLLSSKGLISEYKVNISRNNILDDSLNISIELKTIYMKEFIKTSNVLYLNEV